MQNFGRIYIRLTPPQADEEFSVHNVRIKLKSINSMIYLYQLLNLMGLQAYYNVYFILYRLILATIFNTLMCRKLLFS